MKKIVKQFITNHKQVLKFLKKLKKTSAKTAQNSRKFLGKTSSRSYYMALLTALLLIAAYQVGSLTEKVNFLSGKETVANTAQANTVTANTGTTPSPTTTSNVGNVSSGKFPVLGSSNAKVTVIEFGDFRCPYCDQFFKQTESSLISDYVNTGKVKFAFRNMAILGQQSTWAAEAAYCADEQGQFWKYHNWLFANQVDESNLDFYSKANLIQYASNLGINTNQFASCLNTDKYLSDVNADSTFGQSIGATATPSFVINGQLLSGAQPYSTFQTMINQDLAQ